MNHKFFMEEALKEAEIAAALGNYGVGSVIILENKIISRAGNEVISRGMKPYAHAEYLALDRLRDTEFDKIEIYRQMKVYTTLKSCPMCWGRILNCGINAVIYGSDDPDSTIEMKYSVPPIFEKIAPKVICIGGELEKKCWDVFIKTAEEIDKLFVNKIRSNLS